MNEVQGRTGLVLSGGGAYGAFAVGVMKTLFAGRSPATQYEPLKADIFSGTSVGAFNAGVMVSHPYSGNWLESALRLEEVWLDRVADQPGRCGNGIFRVRGSPTDLIDPACLRQPARMIGRFLDDSVSTAGYLLARTTNFLASSEPLEDRVVGLVNAASFVDNSPLRDLLNSVISEERIHESPYTLTITTTNVITGTARYFSNSDFHDGLGVSGIMASTAIPGVFPPVTIDGHLYVDGGVLENTPLNPAIQLGATSLHIIYLDPHPRFIRLKGVANTLDTMLRVYYLMLATKIAEDVETTKWINAGLDAVTQLQAGKDGDEVIMRDVIRVAGQFIASDGSPYKRITIHRYYPETVLGGDLGMMDFRVGPITRMIAEGERVALVHDCAKSGCAV